MKRKNSCQSLQNQAGCEGLTMDRLTFIDGCGNADLVCCKECGSGCGHENENCGYCEKPQPAYDRLSAYEDTGLTPEDIIRLNDFLQSQCAKLLAKNGRLKAKQVLCKDCTYLNYDDPESPSCGNWGYPTPDDGFCWLGKRAPQGSVEEGG